MDLTCFLWEKKVRREKENQQFWGEKKKRLLDVLAKCVCTSLAHGCNTFLDSLSCALPEFNRPNMHIEMGIPVFPTNPHIKEIPERQNNVLTTNIFGFEGITFHRVYFIIM